MASSLTSTGSPLQQQQALAELASSAPARQRPLSCSAANPDFSLTSTTSSSSASSSVSSASAPRSLSTAGGSSTAARRTLVQPRPWRILHRSRMGSSLDRERAREEDTSLDGDVERKDPDPDAGVGSSVDGDEVFIAKKGKDPHLDDKPREASQNGGGGSGSRGGGGGGSPMDAVVRAKSESDIAAHRLAKNGDQRLVVFKTKAERFSARDDSKAAQRQSAIVSKCQPLPLASEPDFEEVPKPQTLPSESSLVRADGCSRRSRSGSRTPDGPKTVTFTEPEKSDLSPARSDNSSDKSDSPRRNVTLNVRDSSVRVSFSKPAVSAKPPLSEKPLTAGKAVTLEAPRQETKPEKPKVPAKPARLSSSFNGMTPAGDPKLSPTSPSAPSAKLGPATPPKADGVEQPRRSSSTLESPKSPLENVLFSMGFTVADAEPKESQSKLVEGQADSGSENKPKPYVYPAETNPQPETKLYHQTVDVVKTTDKVCEPEVEERNDFVKSKCETPVVPDPPEANTKVKEDKKPAKSKEKEIIPKKMIKIKGDKKAEEKAAKAKKKEQKAKEKELKSKKKAAATSDDSDHEKGRVKLFSWKVEFSAKEKSPASQDTASAPKPKEDKKNKKERKKQKLTVKQTTPVLSPSETAPPPGGVQTEQEEPAIEETVTAATSKKTEKGDGSSGSTSGGGGNKSPHDRKDPPSPQPPPEELQQQQQDQQQQQQQQQQEASQMQDGPPQRQATPSPQPHHHQHEPPPQQPLPRQPPPKPKHLDDLSSSDQNSDLDSLYGSLRRSQGKSVQISESDGETTPQGSIGHGRRLAPRRHTVGGAQIREQLQLGDDIERKREAFYELLANRYPEYADKITGMALYQSTSAAERNPRPREPQRRRTTAVVYNPHSNRSLDYDDPGTMSDVELSSFQRGGYARTSLPIVRSASSSLERPIGLVFLVYRDETKKALLPNEITSLDTVRALFVRAFPEKLTMEFLDSPKRKIYILETATSIFFQLEDLRDIQDRTVLKIHECDSEEPQRVKSQPEVRGRAVQKAVVSSSRPASRQGFVGESGSLYRDEMAKAQSLPVSTSQNYQDLMMKERAQWEMEQEYLHAQQRRSRSRSQTPEPAERPRSLSTGAPRSRYSHSPDRIPTPDRAPPHLNPIPENPRLLANGFRDAAMNGGHYETLPGVHSHPHHPAGQPHPGPPGRVLSPTPMGQPIYESVYQAGGYPQSYVSHSMRAAPPQGPQRATGPPPDMRGNARGGPSSRHSLAFAAMSNPIYDSFPQRTQSYRVTPERDVLPARPQSATPHDMNRMERMEAQIASLAAWVHQVQASPSEPMQRRPGSSRSMSSGHSEGTDTYPGSSASSLSDIPAAYSLRQPVVTSDMREKINDMQCRMRELRVELQGLRRMEQLNQEAMRDAFTDTLARLKKVMSAVPGAENQVVRYQRMEVNALAEAYMQDKAKVEKELSDLETSVEELKEDVIARKCRVNVTDIEGLALLLSNITKSLADLKARFPQVHESLKKVMAGEMEIVVKEEKFIKEEPLQIEAALKRCKKLTSTLYTLKRLATVQDARPPQIPSLAQECKEVGDHDKMAILESIRTMIPDHETRVQSLEAADASRERKKKFVTQHESLKFSKSLQAASKSLKHPDAQAATSGTEPGSRKTSAAEEMLDSKKCEPPAIPAKPARLLSASELKKSEAGSAAPETTSSHPTSSVSHTVTVTSQISDSGDKKAVDALPSSRSSARSVFFSSLQSPATSPTSQPEASKTVSKLPSASRAGSAVSSASGSLSATSLGAAAVSTSPSHSKPVSGVFYQALSPTRTRSAFSSIPLPSKPSSSEKEDSSGTSDKGKKVPPPPPPRKSSAKLPYGLGAGSAHSSNVNGGAEASLGRRDSGEKAPDSRKKDSAFAYKASSPTSPGAVGPLSSTPKPATPQKPAINKFQKDLAAGVYANLNRPDLQHQRMVPDRLLTSMASPPPAAVTTNSQDPQDEGDLSGSESTGSSTSLDSQQGLVLLRGNSAASSKEAHSSPASRGPKPNPPQRHSSLSSKGSAASEESGARTKTQMLQERSRKSQDTAGSGSGKVSGSAFSQVNGLNSTKNGHKT